jgi:ABC-type transport system involved in multi-copper enzyme maturation permease subunit
MLRKTLALLVRALRVDARSIRPHLVRLGLLVTILWLLFIADESSRLSGAPGLVLFQSLTYVNTWFITIVGVTYFASAITEEKEERTLGLLKMADIGGASILLGKWAPRVLGMLSLVAVQFPFTLLAVTLGGVTQAQVNAVYAALFLHLLSVGTYSLLASVYCRNTGTACRVAFTAIFLRWMIPTLAWGIAQVPGTPWLGSSTLERVSQLNDASIYTLTSRALSTTFAEGPFPAPAAWWLAESVCLFLVAWLLFEPCTRGDVLSEARPSVWSRWTARKQRSHNRRAWASAITGKDFMLLAGGMRGSTLRFVGYATVVMVFLAIINIGGGTISPQDAGGTLLGFGFGFLVLDIAQSAAKVFRVELQDQTWSALMMLPRNANGIAWAKIGGCAIGWWPSLLMIFVGGLLVPNAVTSLIDGIFHPEAFLAVLYFAMQVVLFLELTVWTSITLTWAAWPLAAPLSFFLVFICNSILMTCFLTSMSGGDGIQVIFFVLSGISGALAVLLYRRIGLRLIARAADGA